MRPLNLTVPAKSSKLIAARVVIFFLLPLLSRPISCNRSPVSMSAKVSCVILSNGSIKIRGVIVLTMAKACCARPRSVVLCSRNTTCCPRPGVPSFATYGLFDSSLIMCSFSSAVSSSYGANASKCKYKDLIMSLRISDASSFHSLPPRATTSIAEKAKYPFCRSSSL
ncbi:MAG: hypothetical protein BWY65_01724 [Firmicutes bacterium ADurb.Bin373]|nr:MAG: hypothetical protein BWY65_01724 [Firmicutes bacterium ADurb.Bin373]